MAQYNDIPEGFSVVEQYDDIPEGFNVVEPEESEPRSLSEKVFRGIGLAGRFIAETPALTLAALRDVGAKGLNKGIDVLSAAGEAIGDEPIDYRFSTDLAPQVYEGFSSMGFPESETQLEQYGENVSRALVLGGANIAGGGRIATQAASPVTRGVGQTLTTVPAQQATAIATGVPAATYVEQEGGGPIAQAAAGIAGGGAPALLRTTGAAATRGVVRGASSSRTAENVADFRSVGAQPSVAQATQSRTAQGAESYASRAPGSAGRMVKTAEAQAEDIAAGLEQRAASLAQKSSAEKAGRVIEEGITAKGGFVERFRAVQNRLYTRLEELVQPETKVNIDKTRALLDDMTGIIPGAEATSSVLSSPALKRMAEALAVDIAEDGTIPFSALRALRSKVGEKLSTVGLADDVKKVEWKRLYGALSSDMKAAVQAADNPQATQAWARANAHTRAGHARIETIERVIKAKGGPEKVFNAALSGTREGATVLRSVMQSLDRESQKILTATVLRRMGLATPGAQNELGSVFSTERFLTNWNGLSGEARRTLFNRFGAKFSRDMDTFAKVAANLREGGQVFRNPSGTQQASAQFGTIATFIVSGLTLDLKAVGAAAGFLGVNNVMARVLTNPKAVDWLARSTKMPMSQIPAQIAILESHGNEDMALLAVILSDAYRDYSDADTMPELQEQ